MAVRDSTKTFTFIALIFIIKCLTAVTSASCTGCLELDNLTFDKILKKFSTVLIKFDIAYPYGDKHEAYAKFAAEISPENGDFVVAVVGIKDYGIKENSDLAERLRVGDKYPVIKLFRNGKADESIDYPNELNVTVENLRQFVRRHSNVYMALNGCLQRFDELATEFVRVAQTESAVSEQLNELLHGAEDELNKLKNEKDQISGNVYVLFMKRIQEKGLNFVSGERKRLLQLIDGKISDKKKAEINQKLNILSAFNHEDSLRTDSHIEL